jgi:predicted DNA-binding transcriptional regulator AlpA
MPKENPAKVLKSKTTFIKAAELSDLIGMSRGRLYSMVRSRRIPHLRIDTMIRFDPWEVADWLESNELTAIKPRGK